MDPFREDRRALLLALGGFGFDRFASQPIVSAQAASRYVLGPNEGEHLVHFRDSGTIYIKASPATGWSDLTIGTQQVKVGTGIPIHRHFEMNESFYVLEGEGTVILDDVRHSCAKGSTIFIPKMTWHGFENPDGELLLFWMVTARFVLPGNLQPAGRAREGTIARANPRNRSQVRHGVPLEPCGLGGHRFSDSSSTP